MDILHPLVTVDWEECPGCELKSDILFTSQAVTIRDAFYVATRDKIYATTTDFTSWTVLQPPNGLECFGLTSYNSQLMVVGGKERGNVTNKVWTSDNGTDWQLSLPPMPNGRVSPLATNTGPSPECAVVVAGGKDESEQYQGDVEVLTEMNWHTVKSNLQTNRMYSCLFHDGTVYCFVTHQHLPSKAGIQYVAWSKLESLLAARNHMPKEIISCDENKDALWKFDEFWDHKSNLVSFGQHLVACDPLTGTLQDIPVQAPLQPLQSPPDPLDIMMTGFDRPGGRLEDPSTWFLYTTGDKLVLLSTLGDVKKVFRGSLGSK